MAGIDLSPGRDTPVDGRVFESPSGSLVPRAPAICTSGRPAFPPLSTVTPRPNPFQAAAGDPPSRTSSEPELVYAFAGRASLSRHAGDSQDLSISAAQDGEDLPFGVQHFDRGSAGGPGASIQSDPGGEMCVRTERQVSLPVPHTQRKRRVRAAAVQKSPTSHIAPMPSPIPDISAGGSTLEVAGRGGVLEDSDRSGLSAGASQGHAGGVTMADYAGPQSAAEGAASGRGRSRGIKRGPSEETQRSAGVRPACL
jgi:hypothetical protein